MRCYGVQRSGLRPVVWLHGGGFVAGGLDQRESHAVATAIARTGHAVVSVDYRLAPLRGVLRRPRSGGLTGIRFPVPLDDVTDAFAWVREQSPDGRVVLGGASAGACLAAATALRLGAAGQRGPDGLILAYGIFHARLPALTGDVRSRTSGRFGLLQFRPGLVDRMNHNYAGSRAAMAEPAAFPGGHDLAGMPPSLMIDADRDTLRASGELFASELRAAGTPVDHHVVRSSFHGFLDRPQRPAFDEALRLIIDWLARG